MILTIIGVPMKLLILDMKLKLQLFIKTKSESRMQPILQRQ